MELRQLQLFVAAAEERHFTRAARRMHIVQSGLSAAIRALEQELGTPLFGRTTRRVDLTEAGRAFLPEARRVLAAVQGARDAVAQVEALGRGNLTLGTMFRPLFDLPALLARYRAAHPGVEVRLIHVSPGDVLAKVREGELDLGITVLGGQSLHRLNVAPLSRPEPIVLACGPAHRLAKRKSVSLSELREEPFVDLQLAWTGRLLVDRAFASAGVERRTAFEVNDVSVLLELVAHGLGVALLPEPVLADRPELRGVTLDPPGPVWQLVVVTPKGSPLSAAARAFLELLPMPARARSPGAGRGD